MEKGKCASFSEYIELLHLVLDNEASEAEERSLLIHLDQCEWCRQAYDTEQKFRNLIKGALKGRRVTPEDLEELIKKRILLSIDSPR